MTAQIIDGKAVASRVRDEVAQRAADFTRAHDRKPGLEVVLVGNDPASEVYVRNKERASVRAGMRGAVHRLPVNTGQQALESLISELNADSSVDGILVQMPLPKGLDADRAITRIDASKDVDGLSALNAGRLVLGQPCLVPCTPLGCLRLLDEIGCDLTGKRAVVVGRSHLVGKPVAQLLLARNATVTMAHSRTKDLAGVVAESDVVIAAVGRPGLIRGEWIKPGAVVLDVGINRGKDDKLYGDVEFDVAKERASWITPVPGGVGPMTIAMLLSNTVDAAEARLRGK